MEKITRRVLELARCYGAGAVGVVTTEMLAEGPPSTDLTYVLPDAKSAVSFALPLDQGLIEPWPAGYQWKSPIISNIKATRRCR